MTSHESIIASTKSLSHIDSLGMSESIAVKRARENIMNINTTGFTEYKALMESNYRQVIGKKDNFSTFSEQIAKESISKYNEMVGYRKELFDTAIIASSPFSDPSYKKMLEAEKSIQTRIAKEYMKITDSFEPAFAKQIQDSIVNPAKEYLEQMQVMINEPILKMKEYATIGLSRVEELQKFHFDMKTTNQSEFYKAMGGISLQDSITEILQSSSIEDIRHLSTVTYDSYKHIHNILDHDIISSVVPTNINSLVQEMINTESITEQYFKITQNKVIDVAIDEKDIWIELESISNDILNSINNKTQELNQTIEKLHTLILAQKDPKIIIFFQQYLLPIILSLMASFIFKYLDTPKESILKNKNQRNTFKKQLTQSIKTYVPSFQDRKRYRLVTANTLNVREGKSIKTTAIGHLEFANIVEIVKKEKNWALVKRYDADSETVIQGWVFTRYLAQIK